LIAANFDTTELRFIPAKEPLAKFKLLAKRKKEVKYYAEHWNGDFYILTNERAVDFKVMRTPVAKYEKRDWAVWMPHRQGRALHGLLPHKDFFALSMREHGAEEIYIHKPGNPSGKRIPLPERAHSVTLWTELEYESPIVRLTYQSLLSPRVVYDYNVQKKKMIVRKKQTVPKWNPDKFTSKRIWADSKGTKVPVSLAYKKTVKLNGTAPMYVEAYGSYGMSSDPYFSISKASLLERGWIVVTAHPRGGGEMGWSWHKQAKLMTKHRTYQDVIACIDTLVKKKYGAREKTALVGGSAGGMMVGAVLNIRPDVVGAAIAYVPAADLITSSLDESLGGTRLHYDETGDPRKRAMYKYLLRYSPYENVKSQNYPALLVRANMNDIRTPYWEAAKWVARLRAKKTDQNPLLFKTETVAGHFGKSGRYEWIKDRAFDFAFLIMLFEDRR
jgi:oligopeptidase B